MKMKKTIIRMTGALLSIGMIALGFAGCTGGSNTKSTKVGFILPDLTQEFFAGYGSSVKQALEQAGYQVTLASYGGVVATAKEQIETFTTQGVKMIIMMGATPDLQNDLKAARKEGVKILLAGNEIEGAYDVCLVADNTQIGGLIGSMAAQYYKSVLANDADAEVLAMVYNYGGPDMQNRSTAMVNTFRTESGISPAKVHEVEFDSSDVTGQVTIENSMIAYPNIKMVLTYSDTSSLAALNIFKANNKSGPEYAIYGSDATIQALLEIAGVNGPSIYRGTVSMGDIVSQTTENALKLLQNEFETLPFRNAGPGVPITADNIALFLPPPQN